MTERGTKVGWRLWAKRIFLAGLALGLVGIAFIAWANLAAVHASRGILYDDVNQVPPTKVGLVFGTTDRAQNRRENLYFRYRIDAAEKLWKAGKIQVILVSGDNSEKYYNEPEKMRRELIERGIPRNKIVCDYAGLRTLDSVVRAKEIFGLTEVVLVSQRFHNERAAYLAQANGMKVTGFNARDVEGPGGLPTKWREVRARVLMWLDVNVLGTRPRHLGEKETLPE